MDDYDDVQLAHPPVRVQGNGVGAAFDVDDAFSDDEQDADFDFSPSALRADVAKSQSRSGINWDDIQDDAEDLSAHVGFAQENAIETDASVSTFDLDRDPPPAASVPTRSDTLQSLSTQSSQSFPGSELSAQFDHVSLSDGQPSPTAPHTPPIQEAHEEAHISNYPTITIDASEPRSSMDTEASYTRRDSEPTLSLPTSTQSLPESPSEPQSAPPTTPHFPALATPRALTSASSSALPSSPPPALSAKHRSSRSSSGPSALEKVISKTRPSFLPPKPKTEDLKHMADWEAMMKQSRLAEEKRRKALQERRIAREKKIDESLHMWQKQIMPDWRLVHKNPALRKLWWSGIPTSLRASMWERAVGNGLALNKDNFRTCHARAQRALSAGTFPGAALAQIDADIASTLPALHIFLPGTGPLHDELRGMLVAWVVARSDEGLGYARGAARVAGMLLLTMSSREQAFVVMRNLLERHCMRSFYGGEGAKDDVEAYYRIFDTLLADGMPKIYFNFKQHQISPAAYLPDWLIPLFLDHLPFEACARLWDVILLEGDSFLFRAALAILAVLEPRLFFPERKELLELLRGENKAAIEVAKRDGRALDGGKYEIYGLDEETLWDRIDGMDEWWKESTWTRLLQRELPDV